MPKILTRAGESLADQYDLQGSNVSINELVAGDVSLVHDMGEVLLSERMEIQFLQISADAVGENTTFGVTHAAVPDTPTRLLQISMIANQSARISRSALYLQDQNTEKEIPLFTWDSGSDSQTSVMWSDDGGAVATAWMLRATTLMPQQLLMRTGVLHGMPAIIMRGRTSGFGAGTVTLRCLMIVARPSGGPDGATVGLPIPSW